MDIRSIDPEADSRRWRELVSLLSMDVVRPFYGLMGLRLRDPDGLQRLLRQEIVRVRKKFGGPVDADQGVVQAVVESLGTEAGRHLVWWEQHVFHNDSRDHRDLDRWDDVLRRCRHDPDLWARLFSQHAIREEALDRFRRSLNFEEFEQREDEVAARLLSDWDLHLYALRLYDDRLHKESSPGRFPDGPLFWVEPTVQVYQGYQFWAWVLKSLRPDQLDHLRAAAEEIGAREGLTSIGELVHPSSLDIGL